VEGITINQIANGKILDSYASWDALGLMRQLGHAPALGKTILAGGSHGLTANTISINGVIVVYLSGAILFGEESASLRTLVKDLLNKSRHIVLDLGEVTHIDSEGLGTLVALYVSARMVGGNIKLANLGRHPSEVLKITKLVTVFEVFDKTEEAIASFNRALSAR
jgi:anti-anti-sigma factor